MKTFAQIHEQALDLMARLANRPHTTSRPSWFVSETHRRYHSNILRHFSIPAGERMTEEQLDTPVSPEIYTKL